MDAWNCGVVFRDRTSRLARLVCGALADEKTLSVRTMDPAAKSIRDLQVVVLGAELATLDADESRLCGFRGIASGCPMVAAIDALDTAQIRSLFASGAYDVVSGSAPAAEIVARVMRAAALAGTAAVTDLRAAMSSHMREFVGTSASFVAAASRLPTLAGCDAGVLLLGETGTGKEVCAHAIHYLSARASKPLVALNCGAMPLDLLESELFGHVRGAFTTAYKGREGLVREAEGGTLFLDDIDCLSQPAQAKLLRFLELHEYRPVGSNTLCRADVRVIAASNDRLPQLAACGAFRQDLYFRLSVLTLKLPPLRERREDIAALAMHFVARFAGEFSRRVTGLGPSALQKLMMHDWPGNVRELKHVIERAVLMARGDVIESRDVEIDGDTGAAAATDDSFGVAKSRIVEDFERRYIEQALARCQGNVSRAALLAKKNRRAFFALIQKHDIDPARFRG
jgi:two-component system response regulator GlrR